MVNSLKQLYAGNPKGTSYTCKNKKGCQRVRPIYLGRSRGRGACNALSCHVRSGLVQARRGVVRVIEESEPCVLVAAPQIRSGPAQSQSTARAPFKMPHHYATSAIHQHTHKLNIRMSGMSPMARQRKIGRTVNQLHAVSEGRNSTIFSGRGTPSWSIFTVPCVHCFVFTVPFSLLLL